MSHKKSWLGGYRSRERSASGSISEQEEITETQLLKDSADTAFDNDDFTTALYHYGEALKLDSTNLELLSCRSATNIELGDYMRAQKDVEVILSIDSKYPQAQYLMGVISDSLHQYKDALKFYLEALNMDSEHEDILADNIINLMPHFCNISDDTIAELQEMESYNKLCEMGTILCVMKKYNLSIRVLNVARKMETNQQGLRMKVLLTLANAHAALRHNELASGMYQDCLTTAINSHDAYYQIKSLVSMASLYMDIGDTYQAIVYYERLLDLEEEMHSGSARDDLSVIWPVDLQTRLHLNLSVAYKDIGNLGKAVEHGLLYVKLVDQKETQDEQPHDYIGQLYETLGQYQTALVQYQKFLASCKKSGDKKKIATSYGHLGTCYAQLHNWKLALTYHEQHFNVAHKLGDKVMIVKAAEQLGDTYMMMENYEKAVECYEEMFSHIKKSDAPGKVNACCKLGKAFKLQDRHQYGLYYYEEGSDIAEDLGLTDIKHLCQYHMSTILQHSTQMLELEEARKYLEKVIPAFENTLDTKKEESAVITEDSFRQLEECYVAIQNVHNKLGNKEDALIYAETSRQKTLTDIKIYSGTSHHGNQVTMDYIRHIVDGQNCLVLYYTVLPNTLLLWVLQPGAGLVRYYTHRATKGSTMNEHIADLCRQMLLADGKAPGVDLQYICENRSLPLKSTELELERKKNELKSSAPAGSSVESSETGTSATPNELEFTFKPKTPDRQLYDLLLSPVDDILSTLDLGTNVVVVPHKELHSCPFSVLKDWNGKFVDERFSITYMPSLYALNKVTQSELKQLRDDDDLLFERSKTCMAGLGHMIKSQELSGPKSPRDLSRLRTDGVDFGNIDSRKISNPRLFKSGAYTNPDLPGAHHVTAVTRENTLMSLATNLSRTTGIPSPPVTPNIKLLHPLGAPTSLDRMVSSSTISTLSTKTSTGTDIITSQNIIAEYKQISNQDKCYVCGNPKLTNRLQLNNKDWLPHQELSVAQQEVFSVAKYMDSEAHVGGDLTKERFIEGIQTATCVHIATWGCLNEGFLVMSPNLDRKPSPIVETDSYLVTCEDIVNIKLKAKLVVLSSGWCPYGRHGTDQTWLLPSVFLAAGAQCVLHLLWPVPDAVLEQFYFHFYRALQTGCKVSEALKTSITALQTDDRYNNIAYWSPFVLVGKDTHIDLSHIHRAMTDQTIDNIEKQVMEHLQKDLLNPKPANPDVPEKEDIKQTLQEIISIMLCHHRNQPNVMPTVINLLDGALKRLHSDDLNRKKTAQLSADVVSSQGGMKLLKLLGFNFQDKGADVVGPYIVYPHCNSDELLLPSYDALRSCQEILFNVDCTQALHQLFPTSETTLAHLIDLFSITKHASEIQLKIKDVSVRPLWVDPRTKYLLHSIGFHQVGLILNFNRTPDNKKLLSGCLQLLLSLSTYKSNVLMHKLDVTKLGSQRPQSRSTISDEHRSLPTLSPLILPRNQLRMCTPWFSYVEQSDEMREKIKLSKSKSDLSLAAKQQITRAKTWHKSTLSAQAQEAIDKIGQPRSAPTRVKVVSGATASKMRVPVSSDSVLSNIQVDNKRDYAHHVLDERLNHIVVKHRDSEKKLYLPHLQNIH